jgi:RNA polymerase sigma-70 factor (ECF subfamily)
MFKFLIVLLTVSFSLFSQDALPFYKETEHFRLYCLEGDQEASDETLTTLESNYNRVARDFNDELEKHIPIEIYPSIQAFHERMGRPQSGDWFIALANKKDLPHLKAGLYMVSLRNPGSVHNQNSMHLAAIHELTHFFIFKKAQSDLPGWMHEGVANYETVKFGTKTADFMAKSIHHMAEIWETKGIPTLSMLSTLDSDVFCEIGGYAFSYTLIEFIVQRWNFETLLHLIQRFDRFEAILGVTKESFESEWKEFVTNRYLSNHQWIHSSFKAQ